MTTPAPSPGPVKRSKRLYVYWGVSLTLLIAAGLICWLVVVPFLEVRATVERLADEESTAAEVKRLGGPDEAMSILERYLRMPESIAPHKTEAARAFGRLGPTALPGIKALLKDDDYNVRVGAVFALWELGPGVEGVEDLLKSLAEDKTETGLGVWVVWLSKDFEERKQKAARRARADHLLNNPLIISALQKIAQDEKGTPRMRQAARAALETIRQDEKEKPEVRQAAAEALKRIRAAQEKGKSE